MCTKAKSPRLKLRQLNRNTIKDDITKYAENVAQLYFRIKDFLNGDYAVGNGFYDQNSIFGISVVLEDSYIPRDRVYEKAFEIISENSPLNQKEKEYIHGRIKILPLRAIEDHVLRNKSIVPILAKQLLNPPSWDDYQFMEEFDTDSYISDFEDFYNNLLDTVKEMTLI